VGTQGTLLKKIVENILETINKEKTNKTISNKITKIITIQ